MQALKDAGIVLVVVLLASSVRITPIEPAAAADARLLAPPVEAATAEPEARAVGLGEVRALAKSAVEAMPLAVRASDGQMLPATPEIVDRCARIVLELTEGGGDPEPFVVVFETEEDDEAAPSPCT